MPAEHSDKLAENFEKKSQIGALMPFCLNAPETPDLPVQTEEKYKTIKDIDAGGMKRVEVIYDTVVDRHVARAFLNEDKDWLKEKFLQEARLTAQLDHPNIVPVYEIGQDEKGKPYFTMKWLQGETLAAILRKLKDGDETYKNKYQRSYMIDLFQRVCEAVAFAHSKGVAHLDLKPANIIVSEFGEVYLIDWGLARYFTRPEAIPIPVPDRNGPIGPQVTHDGMVRGTPGYMAPEQAIGAVKHMNSKTDVYALGAILYSILTYRIPIGGDDVRKILDDTITGKVILPRKRCPDLDIPDSLEAVVMKAMQKIPENRYPSVADLLKDISRYREGFATSAESPGTLKLLGLLIKRNKMFCLITGPAAVIILTLSVLFVVSLTHSEKKAVQYANMLEQEVTRGRKLGYLASKQYLTQARNSFYQYHDFANSIPFAKMAIDMNPRNREALIFYGFLQLGRQHFRESYDAFQKAEYKDNPKLLRVVESLKHNEEPSPQNIKKLLEIMQDMQSGTRPSDEFLYFCMNIRRHMFSKSVISGFLESITNNSTKSGISIRCTENSIQAEIGPDAEGIAWSTLLLQVTDLKLKDRGNCVFLLPYMPYLQTLDLSNLPLSYLDGNLFNNNYALHEITLDGTSLRVLDSHILRDSLKKLSIRNCSLFDLTCLLTFKSLKQVVISADSPAARNTEAVSALGRKGITVTIQ